MEEIPDVITASEARLLRKRLTLKKPRKPIEKSAHSKALNATDAAFSIWARAMWADEQGAVRCSTCGVFKLWKMPDKSLHWGHWQSRGANAVRYDFHNGACQCANCNRWKEGDKPKMREFLEGLYGKEEMRRIEIAAKTQRQISDFELKERTKFYREEARKIIKQKGLI